MHHKEADTMSIIGNYASNITGSGGTGYRRSNR